MTADRGSQACLLCGFRPAVFRHEKILSGDRQARRPHYTGSNPAYDSGTPHCCVATQSGEFLLLFLRMWGPQEQETAATSTEFFHRKSLST